VCASQPQPIRELRPDLPPGLAALIGQLLQKPPHLRPASAQEVAERLAQLAAELSASLPRAAPLAAETTLQGAESATVPALPAGSSSLRASPTETLGVGVGPRRFLRSHLALGLGALLLAVAAVALLSSAPWRRPAAAAAAPGASDPYVLYQQGMALLDRY